MKLVCNSVCVFVFRQQPDSQTWEYLLMKRTQEHGGFWQPVTGRVEKREKAEDAARREVFEETGFQTAELIVLEKIHMYFKPGKKRVYFEPCFGVQVNSGEAFLSKEHDEYAWLDYDTARERLPHSGLREALLELHERPTVS